MLHANLSFVEPELWAIEVYIAGMGIFEVFGSCDLDLDLMTFVCELDPYFFINYALNHYQVPSCNS